MQAIDGCRRPNLVVALAGLPGSGKTSAAICAREAPTLADVQVDVVSFDSFHDTSSTSELAIDRDGALARVRELCATASANFTVRLIIVDDNLYYRSMRKEVYRIARDAGWAFLQVLFEVPLEIALARNARRRGPARVPDTIVQSMSARFEAPRQKGWDVALHLDAVTADSESFASLLLAHWPAVALSPAAVLPAAAPSALTTAHELDIALRQEIHALVLAAPAHARKDLAARLAAVRRAILAGPPQGVAASLAALHREAKDTD